MFRRIAIKNFRSVEDATVELASFSVVVGPNGSGKSNFADALVFLRDVASDASTAVSGRGGISSVRRWTRSRPCDVRLEMRVSPTRAGLDENYLQHSFTISSHNEGAWRFKRETIELHNTASSHVGWLMEREGNSITTKRLPFKIGDVPETTSLMLFVRQMLKLPSILSSALLGVRRYRLNPDEMRRPQLVTEDSRLVESGMNIATALRRLRETKGFDDVLAAMQKIVPGLLDICVVEAGRHLLVDFVQVQSNGSAHFTASEMSEGAIRALGIVVAAKQMALHELLIIEEPEANIHAGATRLLYDVLKEASSQGSVIVTTHSPELLDSAQDDEILVCRYEDGATRVGPLDLAQRQVVREGLFRVAELMRMEPLRIEGDEQPVAEP